MSGRPQKSFARCREAFATVPQVSLPWIEVDFGVLPTGSLLESPHGGSTLLSVLGHRCPRGRANSSSSESDCLCPTASASCWPNDNIAGFSSSSPCWRSTTTPTIIFPKTHERALHKLTIGMYHRVPNTHTPHLLPSLSLSLLAPPSSSPNMDSLDTHPRAPHPRRWGGRTLARSFSISERGQQAGLEKCVLERRA